MKLLFALVIALLLSSVSPTFCQPPDGPDIFPDEHIRKLARELDLKTVKSVLIDGDGRKITVTNPQHIAQIIKGLKTADTTAYSNKVDYLEVTGKNGKALISYSFSINHLPEVSLELIRGLKAAGAAPRSWAQLEEADKWQRRITRNLLIITVALASLMALIYGFAHWKYRVKH